MSVALHTRNSGADNQTNCAFGDKSTKLGTRQLHIIVVILKMGDTNFFKIDMYETKDKMVPKYHLLTFYVFVITTDDIQNWSIKTK